MNDYILKTEAEEQLQKKLEEESMKAPAIDVKQTEEYKALENKVNMYSSFETEDFEKVKKPYREMIWDRLDHTEKHAPYGEQMSGLMEKYPDMFTEINSQEEEKPQFGGDTVGTIPNGNKEDSFSDYWGYTKK
jgi:hypothetical protein